MSTNNPNDGMDSDVEIGRKSISGVVDGEEPDEILGHMMMSTTGDVRVPRDWLVDVWDREDLPQYLLPSPLTDWRAYRRAKNHVLEGWEGKHYQVHNDEYNRDFDVKLELEKSDEDGLDSSNVYVLYAKTFWPEELIGTDHGDWQRQRLGYFDFHAVEDGPSGVVSNIEIDRGSVHYEAFERTYNRFRNLYHEMNDGHNGQDLLGTLSDFRNHANTVSIRRSVYFVPASESETVQALSRVWDRLGQFKDGGDKTEIATVPVIDTQDQRELIQDRAEDMMADTVDEVVDAAFEQFDLENQASEIAKEIMSEMEDMDSFAAEYNALLEAKMDVEDILRERMQGISEEREKVLQQVIEQDTLE